VKIEGIGLELRYARNGKPFLGRTCTDGRDLVRAAAIEQV
jgi:hypothetical protein